MENDFTIRTQINVAVLHGSIGACGFSRGYLLTMQNTLWGFSGKTVRSPAGNGNCIAARKRSLSFAKLFIFHFLSPLSMTSCWCLEGVGRGKNEIV
jgi:hypothetical protein